MGGRLALVTGGGGFIGQSLVRRLAGTGWAVRNLDFVPTRLAHPEVTHWAGSFLQADLLREAMVGVDTVFHLAATNFAREANARPLSDCQENVAGTLALADAAVDAGVRRIVFSSSGGTVYGPAQTVPITEDHPTCPITAYGISKLACEHYLRFYDGRGDKRELTTVTLRLANPYGPNQNIGKAQGALTTFCHHAATGQPIVIWGDGTVERDFIHVEDVARALAAAADASARGTEINIGSGRGTSLNQILSGIRKVLGRPLDVEYQPGRGFDVPRSILCTRRAARLLDWHPEIDLESGIRELLEHFAPVQSISDQCAVA